MKRKFHGESSHEKDALMVHRGIWIFTIFENGNISALPFVARCKKKKKRKKRLWKATNWARPSKWRSLHLKTRSIGLLCDFFLREIATVWKKKRRRHTIFYFLPRLLRLCYHKLFLRHSALPTSFKRKLLTRPFDLTRPEYWLPVAVHVRKHSRWNNFAPEGQFG